MSTDKSGRVVLTCIFCTKKKAAPFENMQSVRLDNLSRHTQKNHSKILKKVRTYMNSKDVTVAQVEEYIQELSQEEIKKITLPDFLRRHKIQEFRYDITRNILDAASMLGFDNTSRIFTKRTTDKFQTIVYKHVEQFEYLAELLEGPSSYTEIERITMLHSKRAPKIKAFRGINRSLIARTVTRIGLISLSMISLLISKVRGFSLVLDGSRWDRMKHCAIRFRIYNNEELRSIFVGFLPITKPPSGTLPTQHLFNRLRDFFDLLVPCWRHKIVGITTDGAADMIGKFNGLQLKFRREAEYPIQCVWWLRDTRVSSYYNTPKACL